MSRIAYRSPGRANVHLLDRELNLPEEKQAPKILHGNAAQVAAGIRRRATTYGYSPAERAGADECARYLDNKKDYLGYATALQKGWPNRHRDN